MKRSTMLIAGAATAGFALAAPVVKAQALMPKASLMVSSIGGNNNGLPKFQTMTLLGAAVGHRNGFNTTFMYGERQIPDTAKFGNTLKTTLIGGEIGFNPSFGQGNKIGFIAGKDGNYSVYIDILRQYPVGKNIFAGIGASVVPISRGGMTNIRGNVIEGRIHFDWATDGINIGVAPFIAGVSPQTTGGSDGGLKGCGGIEWHVGAQGYGFAASLQWDNGGLKGVCAKLQYRFGRIDNPKEHSHQRLY